MKTVVSALLMALLSGYANAGTSSVLILECSQNETNMNEIVAVSASYSTSAPTVSKNSGCAQLLADAMDKGFKIDGISPQSDGVVYTLIK